jgi:hypothetical protein
VLPDGIFEYQKFRFGYNFEGLGMKNDSSHLVFLLPIGILYGPNVYFVVIWYISPVLVYFTNKNLATLIHQNGRNKKLLIFHCLHMYVGP